MKPLLLLSIVVVLVGGCSPEQAEFPSKAITIIVPWAAGGGTDGLARSLAKEASNVFGVPVNVVNRVGGTGTMGHSYGGITARPDGYTITMITYELCSYKALGMAQIDDTDFKAVMQVNEDPAAITVHVDSPWQTLQEFIDHAKANPGKITIGNSGPGAVWHLGAVRLEQKADVKFTHIPHDGAKPAVVQLVGKHLDAVAVSPAEVLQYVQQGTLRCLGIMSEERFEILSNVPTFRELGIDIIHGTWRGIAAPGAAPDEKVQILEKGFKQAYDSAEFQSAAKKALFGLKYRDSTAYTSFLRSETQIISELVQGLNM